MLKLSQKVVLAGLVPDLVRDVTRRTLCKYRTDNRFVKLSVHIHLRRTRTDRTKNLWDSPFSCDDLLRLVRMRTSAP
ncbi:MAG: hypothetical protein ACE5K8_05890, partial [Candidatus Zixiibacteriota bacterium]